MFIFFLYIYGPQLYVFLELCLYIIIQFFTGAKYTAIPQKSGAYFKVYEADV